METAVDDLNARIWQAVIAGAFIGLGWFVNGWLNRREAAALRQEKLRDMHRAIYAEIGNYLANLQADLQLVDYPKSILERMQQDSDFVPFIPHEHNDAVFQTLLPNIHVLPRQTIDPIVAYYSQVGTISSLANDMRGETFKTMDQDRRMAIYSDYIEMKKQALQFGIHANRMITAYAKGGAAAADAEAKRLNTPVSDPSDRSQG